jgi:hypothetical protein
MNTRPSYPRQLAPPGYRSRFPAFLRAFVLLGALLLTAMPLVAQSPNEALFNAVEVNDIDAVEAAIAAGADLAAKNPDGMTPADVAVDLGHFRIAHLLLSKRTQATAGDAKPRVSENIKEALSQPRRRVAAPDPKLSDLVPPKKPAPQMAAPAADTAAPETPSETMAEPSPAPAPMDKPAEDTRTADSPAQMKKGLT